MNYSVSDWLQANKGTLQGRCPDEIAALARICGGWAWDEICAAVPGYHMDWATRTTFEIRKRWFVDGEIREIEKATKPDLTEKWHRVWRYENGLDD